MIVSLIPSSFPPWTPCSISDARSCRSAGTTFHLGRENEQFVDKPKLCNLDFRGLLWFRFLLENHLLPLAILEGLPRPLHKSSVRNTYWQSVECCEVETNKRFFHSSKYQMTKTMLISLYIRITSIMSASWSASPSPGKIGFPVRSSATMHLEHYVELCIIVFGSGTELIVCCL